MPTRKRPDIGRASRTNKIKKVKRQKERQQNEQNTTNMSQPPSKESFQLPDLSLQKSMILLEEDHSMDPKRMRLDMGQVQRAIYPINQGNGGPDGAHVSLGHSQLMMGFAHNSASGGSLKVNSQNQPISVGRSGATNVNPPSSVNLSNLHLRNISVSLQGGDTQRNGLLARALDQQQQARFPTAGPIRISPNTFLGRNSVVQMMSSSGQEVPRSNGSSSSNNQGRSTSKSNIHAVVLPTFNLQPPPPPFSGNTVRVPASLGSTVPSFTPGSSSAQQQIAIPAMQIRIGSKKFKPASNVAFKDDGILFTLQKFTYAPVLLNARAILKCKANLTMCGHPAMFLHLEASCMRQIREIFGLKNEQFSSENPIEMKQCLTIFPMISGDGKSQNQHLMLSIKRAFDAMVKRYPRSTPILEEITNDQVVDILLASLDQDGAASGSDDVVHVSTTEADGRVATSTPSSTLLASFLNCDRSRNETSSSRQQQSQPATTTTHQQQQQPSTSPSSAAVTPKSSQESQQAPLLVIPTDQSQWLAMQKDLVTGGVYHVLNNGQRSYCLWDGNQLRPCLVQNTEVRLTCALARFGKSLVPCIGQVRIRADNLCGIYFTAKGRDNKLVEVSVPPVDIVNCETCLSPQTTTIFLTLQPSASEKLSTGLGFDPEQKPFDAESSDLAKKYLVLFVTNVNKDQEEALGQIRFNVIRQSSTSIQTKQQTNIFTMIELYTATEILANIHSGSAEAGKRYIQSQPIHGQSGYERLVKLLSSTTTTDSSGTSGTSEQNATVVDDDDDIIMTQEELGVKCPYTQLVMKEPVRNRRCGHNYEKQAIYDFIIHRKGNAKCPYAGCGNTEPLNVSDLEENATLKEYILNQKKAS